MFNSELLKKARKAKYLANKFRQVTVDFPTLDGKKVSSADIVRTCEQQANSLITQFADQLEDREIVENAYIIANFQRNDPRKR